MNLYLIEQHHKTGYDTYDSAVVRADSVTEAQCLYPGSPDGLLDEFHIRRNSISSWVMPDEAKEHVRVTFLGTATPSLNTDVIICASFNAG